MWLLNIYNIIFTIQIAFALFVIYLIIKMFFDKQHLKYSDKNDSISIVIPFHNEAENLPSLLKSLATQDYKGTYEILLINDQSTDSYSEIIDNFCKNYSQLKLKVINSRYNKTLELTSKQQAIDCGINHTSYEWIAFTDADMILKKNWLSTLIRSTAGSFSIIYGHTTIVKDQKSLFHTIQAFQLEFLFITAYAFHSAGLRGSCMGNNMLVSKEAYQKTGGQSGIGYSIVEDRDLLNSAIKKGYSASASTPFTPTAQTYPCKTVKQFFHQALRWIKGGTNLSSNLLPAMALFSIQNIIFLLAICTLLPATLFWSSIVNVIILGIFVYTGIKKTGSRESILFYPVFYLFCIIETMIMIIPTLFMSPVWKQRKI